MIVRILSLFLFLLSPSYLPAQQAAPFKLRAKLEQVVKEAQPGELLPITIVLKDQVSRTTLDGFRALPRDNRKAQIRTALKSLAEEKQAGLLQYLRDKQKTNQAGPRLRTLWLTNVIGADVTPAVCREIAARSDVAYINHNPKTDVFMKAPPPAPLATECGVSLMRAPDVWSDFGVTGQGAVIAVIDTGVCWTHPDLANQIWVNPGEDLDGDGEVFDSDDENGFDDDGNGFADDLIGWNFDQNSNYPNDTNSHGTHVAGTVAGDGTNGEQTGMAPDAKIMVLRVGVSFADELDVWNAMQYAADNGAHSISMSLGWPHGQNPDRRTWRENCDNVIAMGTAMVVAAGNEGSCCDPVDNVRTPGDVPSVITVGATDCSDNIANFSSRGPVTWETVWPFRDYDYPPGLLKPDVSGPGVGTLSTSNNCSSYSTKSGTSMATPHVAGAVALMVQANPGLTPADIKAVLTSTALDLGPNGADNDYGFGRVQAYEAVESVAGGRTMVWVDANAVAPFLGTQSNPYKTVSDGLNNVADGGTVIIMGPNNYPETIRSSKAATLQMQGGTVTIGS